LGPKATIAKILVPTLSKIASDIGRLKLSSCEWLIIPQHKQITPYFKSTLDILRIVLTLFG
jgi:hypothetical protein